MDREDSTVSFQPVGSKVRLVDRVVKAIQDRIVARQLTPGMMLPPERELGEQLGVSRTALREAVQMLISRGLLETRPGVGTIVKAVTSDQISQPLALILTQSDLINLDHLSQVRMILEVEIARLAAEEATSSDITRLQNLYQQMEEASDDLVLYSKLDGAFHTALAEITHNPLLVMLLDTFRDAMEKVRLMVLSHPGLITTVNRDHQAIVDFIEKRDPGLAGEAMRKHLEHARRIQNEVLGERSINGSDKG